MSLNRRLTKYCSNKKIAVFIFILALIIGSAGYLKFAHIPVEGDALEFKELGKKVASGSWTTSQDFGYVRTPGYPIILGTIYATLGSNDLYVKFAQVILFSIIAVIIYFIGNMMFSWLVGLLSAIWYITYYDFVRIAYLLLREIWITFFILLILLFFILYINKHKLNYIILGSLSFGCLIMIDPRYSFFLFILIGFGLFFSTDWLHKARDLIIIISGLMVFLIPWSVHQSRTHNEFILFSPIRDAEILSFLGTNHIYIHEENKYYPFDMQKEDYVKDLAESGLSSSKKKEIERLLTDEYIQELRSRIPQNKIKIYLHRFHDYWRFAQLKIGVGAGNDVRFRFPWSLSKNLNNIIHIGFLLPFILTGIYLIFKKRQLLQLLILCLLAYHMLFHIVVHYLYRYRYPILPILFLVGWYGVDTIAHGIFKEMGDRN